MTCNITPLQLITDHVLRMSFAFVWIASMIYIKQNQKYVELCFGDDIVLNVVGGCHL